MKAGVALLLIGLFCPCSFAKKWNYDVPCQKVFVTGTQQHEIAWALKGQGLENNLYKNTCMQPVAEAAILLQVPSDHGRYSLRSHGTGHRHRSFRRKKGSPRATNQQRRKHVHV